MGNLTCNTDTLVRECRRSVRGLDIDDDVRVVRLVGELDAAVREEVHRSLVDGDQRSVIVDLSQLVFMDCGGYGALVNALNLLDHRGAPLTIVNATGQIARLFELVGADQMDLNKHIARQSGGTVTTTINTPPTVIPSDSPYRLSARQVLS